MGDIFVSHADQNNNAVGYAAGQFQHLRPASGDVDGHFVFARMQ
jgi:hypothetical protein